MEHVWSYERTNSDELCHYGIKGMRWGFRKKVGDAGRAFNRNKQKVLDVGEYIGSKIKKRASKSPFGAAVKSVKKSPIMQLENAIEKKKLGNVLKKGPAGKATMAIKKDYTKFLIDKYGKKKVSELNKKKSK